MPEAKTKPAPIHCAECTRGGNGDASCSCGWTVKNKKGSNRFRMCFSGTQLKESRHA